MIIDSYSWNRVRIAVVNHIAVDTVSVTLEPLSSKYRFIPGQYTIVKTTIDGSSLMRQYSFSSSPSSDQIEFCIRKEPGGEVSSWFCETARPGDYIEISQPFGQFQLEQPLTTNSLFVAGGVGIAPFMSMLRSKDSAQKITLLYSEKQPDDVCYKTELQQILGDSFYLTISSQTGRIDSSHLKIHLKKHTQVYLCGPKLFVDMMYEKLENLDIPLDHIKREAFTLQ